MNFIVSQIGSHHHVKPGQHKSRDGNGKKLFAIMAMFLVIGYLVWHMG